MLTVDVQSQYDFLSEDYAKLFAQSGATAFQHPIWLDVFYRRLPQQRGAQPVIVTVHEGDELLGVVPLIRRNRLGIVMIEPHNLGVTDYAAPVLSPHLLRKPTVESALPELMAQALGRHDLVRILPVRPEHMEDWTLLFPGDPVPVDFSAHAVGLSEPMDRWRETHVDRKLSSQYRRKAKRWCNQHEVDIRRLTDAADE
ncbi:MAG: hypothetical protein OXR62_06220 [Ahrensia sp.]|nr:hypothetical protein [Ahrensia sp.]